MQRHSKLRPAGLICTHGFLADNEGAGATNTDYSLLRSRYRLGSAYWHGLSVALFKKAFWPKARHIGFDFDFFCAGDLLRLGEICVPCGAKRLVGAVPLAAQHS